MKAEQRVVKLRRQLKRENSILHQLRLPKIMEVEYGRRIKNTVERVSKFNDGEYGDVRQCLIFLFWNSCEQFTITRPDI